VILTFYSNGRLLTILRGSPRPTACLYFDHFLTVGKAFKRWTGQSTKELHLKRNLLGEEIEYLWKRPKKHSSYWFFANRYFAFLGNIAVTILGFADLSVQVRSYIVLTYQLGPERLVFRGVLTK